MSTGDGTWVGMIRGGEVESRHRVDGIVVGLAGGREVMVGEGDLLTYWRSSFKPFQALPVVQDGAAARFDFSEREVALCCASHSGTPAHVEIVRSILDRIGRSAGDLSCGADPPLDREAARRLDRRGTDFGALHNNCSGKHAGMLAAAVHAGWPVDGYADLEHPLQARIRDELTRWLDVDAGRLTWGVDGCGVPTPYLSLRQMARAYARLARASREGGAARLIASAMTGHPTLVAGRGRLVVDVVRATEGRMLVKEGAEGVLCMAAPEAGWGMALKVRDGANRARGPAAVAVLRELGLLDEGELEALESVERPPRLNTAGREIGRAEAEVVTRETVPAHPVGGPARR